MRPRIEQELELLRQVYGEVGHAEDAGEDWFYLPRYVVPAGWQLDGKAAEHLPVAFLIKADYPAAAPYGFLTPNGLNFNGVPPKTRVSHPSGYPSPVSGFISRGPSRIGP